MKLAQKTVDVPLLLLTTALGLSLSANVVLGWKIRGLSSPAPMVGGAKEGSTLPPIEVLNAAGQRETLAFEGPERVVLYIMSPTCGWCERNQQGANQLSTSLAGSFKFIGIFTSTERILSYLSRNRVDFVFYSIPSDSQTRGLQLLGLEVTPQTLVIAPGGKIKKAWMGAYLPTVSIQIEKFFGLRILPLNRLDKVPHLDGRLAVAHVGL